MIGVQPAGERPPPRIAMLAVLVAVVLLFPLRSSLHRPPAR